MTDATQAHELSRKWLNEAERVVALTGAGISTDSGIPDFRGPQGVWTKDPDSEKLSDIRYYLADARIRKKAWKARLESPVWQAQPGPGHHVLARLEQLGKLDTLITQNIDGLHQLAGNSPGVVVEIHGTIRKVQCMSCTYLVDMDVVLKRLRHGEEDPSCPDCSGILKSATISFGQNLVPEDLVRSESAAKQCDLLLAVGSTLSVYPAANLVPIAKQSGARIIIINGGPTDMDGIADAVLRGEISELLPSIVPSAH